MQRVKPERAQGGREVGVGGRWEASLAMREGRARGRDEKVEGVERERGSTSPPPPRGDLCDGVSPFATDNKAWPLRLPLVRQSRRRLLRRRLGRDTTVRAASMASAVAVEEAANGDTCCREPRPPLTTFLLPGKRWSSPFPRPRTPLLSSSSPRGTMGGGWGIRAGGVAS